jgi:hypothetical protein
VEAAIQQDPFQLHRFFLLEKSCNLHATEAPRIAHASSLFTTLVFPSLLVGLPQAQFSIISKAVVPGLCCCDQRLQGRQW